MKRHALSLLIGSLILANAAAQTASQPVFAPVPPPPPMDDPAQAPATQSQPSSQQTRPQTATPSSRTEELGNSSAEAAAETERARKLAAAPVPLLPPEPEKKFDSPGLPPDVQKAAEETELPVVTVRQEGNQTIEEYRKRGKIFAQHIISKDSDHAKWYVDPAYRGPLPPQLGGPGGLVQPVEYKVFGW